MAEVIENILCFLIAASIVIQLAPDESYKKCMKLFIGIVFLVVVVSSIFKEMESVVKSDIFEQIPDIGDMDSDYYENIFNDYYGNVRNEEN